MDGGVIMNANQIVEVIRGYFNTTNNPKFNDESEMLHGEPGEITKIGYCTNLTLETIETAHNIGIDMMITHHDAWDFIYGLKEACIDKLKLYKMSHYYVHLPLDDSDFGTNDSLLKQLGLKQCERTHEFDGFYCGRVAEFDEPIPFAELVKKLEVVLEEPVRSWQFNDRLVKRVGLVCGGGGLTPEIQVAVDKACDVYITGERVLYTLEFAQFKELNLIIGSHTFTEIFGVASLVEKLSESIPGIQVEEIKERRLEAIG